MKNQKALVLNKINNLQMNLINQLENLKEGSCIHRLKIPR